MHAASDVVTITRWPFFFLFLFLPFSFFICPPQYSCRPGYTILNRALCENRFFNSKVSRGLFPVFLTPGNEIKITSGRSSPFYGQFSSSFFSIFFLFFYLPPNPRLHLRRSKLALFYPIYVSCFRSVRAVLSAAAVPPFRRLYCADRISASSLHKNKR